MFLLFPGDWSTIPACGGAPYSRANTAAAAAAAKVPAPRPETALAAPKKLLISWTVEFPAVELPAAEEL